MFEQVANFDTGAYKTMENESAAFAEYGCEIEATVELVGDPRSARPDGVDVDYRVFNRAGVRVYANEQDFANQDDQHFIRLSRSEILRRLELTDA